MSDPFLQAHPDEIAGDSLVLRGARHHHYARVRRARLGDPFRVALPDGRLMAGCVVALSSDALTIALSPVPASVDTPSPVDPAPQSPASSPSITLLPALLKGPRMDWLVEKACELGVATLLPVIAARSVVRHDADHGAGRLARWQRIAASAAAQSERATPLRIVAPLALDAALARAPRPALFLSERAGGALADALADARDPAEWSLFVGPEGGWTPAEGASFAAADVRSVWLGPEVLRAETAALVGVALLRDACRSPTSLRGPSRA